MLLKQRYVNELNNSMQCGPLDAEMTIDNVVRFIRLSLHTACRPMLLYFTELFTDLPSHHVISEIRQFGEAVEKTPLFQTRISFFTRAFDEYEGAL
jgi:hypothetical protein